MSKGTISSDFIRRLVASTDIVETVSRYVSLKKTGRNWMACCPFHHEKTPSFSVSSDKQLYHCFGCHASGDVIRFVQDYERLNFVEAVEVLAEMQGMSIEYEASSAGVAHKPPKDLRPIYSVLELAVNYYQWVLRHHASRNTVVEYIKSRGISGQTAQRFALGYAPNEWDGLLSVARNHYPQTALLDAGLVIERENKSGVYDRFRGRLMFPIRNRKGQVIAFGGRLICDDKLQPKYLNSPETEVFYKHSTLYGLYEIHTLSERPQELLIVEGYMDVVALWENGYRKSVATLGTAFTEQHAKILFREVNRLIFCFDADQAGEEASMRALKTVLPMLDANKEVRFLALPQGEDPDSYITRYGLAQFEQVVRQAYTAVDYIVARLKTRYDINDSEGLAKFLSALKSFLVEVKNPPYVSSVVAQVAKEIRFSPQQLMMMVESKAEMTDMKPLNPWRFDVRALKPMEKILSYLLAKPHLLKSSISGLMEGYQPISELDLIVIELVQRIQSGEIMTSALLVQDLMQSFPNYRDYLYQLLYLSDGLDDDQVCNDFQALILWLTTESDRRILDSLIEKSKKMPLSANERAQIQKFLSKTKKSN